MTANTFLNTLTKRANVLLQQAEKCRQLSDTALNQQPAPEKWSIAQILEHLSRYNDYYLPRFEKAIKQGKPAKKEDLKRTWFGKTSIKMMHPDNAKPQKAMKKLNPTFSAVRADVVEVFIKEQKQFISLLALAEKASLNSNKIPAEVFPLLRLRLGECMEFVITHQERHFKAIK